MRSRSDQIKGQEGDFLETVEGLFFDVKGGCHPPDRIIGYVRYVPCAEGTRKRMKTSSIPSSRYCKIYDLKERHNFLRKHFPHYIYFDPVFQRTLQGVPHKDIAKLYHPQKKLQELILGDTDLLEELAVRLARSLSIPDDTVGVSGSLLVGLHTDTSDIDLIVYGEKFCRKAYIDLLTLREKGDVHPFDSAGAREKALFRWGSANDTLISIEQKKVMHGLYQGKEFFFRFIESEIEPYGAKQYIPLHKATLKADIVDDSQRIFTPCCYKVENSSIEGVVQLISWRGRYCEQAAQGDTICARGTVEKVCTAEDEYYQLVMGEPGDYLLPDR